MPDEVRSNYDYAAAAKEYFAEAERIGRRIKELRQEYRRTGSYLLKGHISNLRDVQRELEKTALLMAQRAEWRAQEKEE